MLLMRAKKPQTDVQGLHLVSFGTVHLIFLCTYMYIRTYMYNVYVTLSGKTNHLGTLFFCQQTHYSFLYEMVAQVSRLDFTLWRYMYMYKQKCSTVLRELFLKKRLPMYIHTCIYMYM